MSVGLWFRGPWVGMMEKALDVVVQSCLVLIFYLEPPQDLGQHHAVQASSKVEKTHWE